MALLLSISSVYEQLVEVLPILEVSKIAATMLDTIPKELPLLLVQAKLVCIKNIVSSKLFQDDGMLQISKMKIESKLDIPF